MMIARRWSRRRRSWRRTSEELGVILLMRKGLISALPVLGAVAAAYLALKPLPPVTAEVRPVWTEVKWGFPIDQWGIGKAFVCKASDCGTDVDVYLRAKIGFCNCTTGVADDAELERVADFDLFGDRRTALAPGRPIEVRWMRGRSRPYAFSGSPAEGKSTFTIAFTPLRHHRHLQPKNRRLVRRRPGKRHLVHGAVQ